MQQVTVRHPPGQAPQGRLWASLGKFVVICRHVRQGGNARVFRGLFRLQGGRITDHRDGQDRIGQQQTGNTPDR